MSHPSCCGRAMTGIEVSLLSLHTCAACGQHIWHRDGQPLDRAALLAAVRHGIQTGAMVRPTRPLLDAVTAQGS